MSVPPTDAVVPLAAARQTATPAAVMRTYASPSGPAVASIAVWRTEMSANASGPLHAVSEDQVVVVLRGALRASVDGSTLDLAQDDSIVLAAGAPRQLVAGPDGAVLLVASRPGAVAHAGSADPVPVPWAS